MKISIKEYMDIHNVSRRTIYNRIASGQLITLKEKNKTYIIKENLNIRPKSKNKLQNNNLDFEKNKEILQELENLLSKFDYSFLKDKIASIEKSLINLFLDTNKNISSSKLNMTTLSETINTKINNFDNKNNQFLENLLIINEQNQNYFKQNLENIESRILSLENQLLSLDEKIDNLLKKQDSKMLGIFQKNK